MASNTVCNQLSSSPLLKELMLHEDFCLQAHLHVLVCLCTCRPSFLMTVQNNNNKKKRACSLLTLRAWFSTFMMSSSCCFLRARVSWSLALTLLICTWYSITAGHSRRFTRYDRHKNTNVVYASAFFCNEERTEINWKEMTIWHRLRAAHTRTHTCKAVRTRYAP